ncbi:MAG: hypothetical protein Q9216_006658 [Gyalolechia sp. 2 TL-2023]
MATRITRGAATKGAAQGNAVENGNLQQQSLKAVAQPKKSMVSEKTPTSKKGASSEATNDKGDANAQSATISKTPAAKTPARRKASEDVQGKSILQQTSKRNETTSIESAPEKPGDKRSRSAQVKKESSPAASATTNKKRKRMAALKLEGDPDELPHGLGKLWKPTDREAQTTDGDVQEPSAKKQAAAEVAGIKPEDPSLPVADPIQVSADAAATTAPEDSPAKKSSKKKAHPYGLTPGISPFPDWPHPTPSECQQVNDLLTTIHGNIVAPTEIPEPSLTFAGCGEVPCVLDALIRTYLSAATSGNNSSRAFKGLLNEYGKQETGVGKGSVNWDAVRLSDVNRVFNAIRSGGLAATKSKNIKKILDMVYEENQARRATLEENSNDDAEKVKNHDFGGAKRDAEEDAKVKEIARAHADHLSLDHLHAMPKDIAFNHMLRYPGIGVKTASCVTLFCLRRPSFAVDTHVFRLCQWLGWVPSTATRDSTFQHCEVRVPEGLKYSLHQLLIMHGKKCGRCRAVTGEGSSGWGIGCVLEELVTRTGLRKGGEPGQKKGGKGKEKRKRVEHEDEIKDEDEDQEEEEVGSEFDKSPRKIKTAETRAPKMSASKGKNFIKTVGKERKRDDDSSSLSSLSDIEPTPEKPTPATTTTPKKKHPPQPKIQARK